MQRLEAAAKEVDAQSSKIFRLEVELAEAQKKLQTTTELEKELNHYRCYSTCDMSVSPHARHSPLHGCAPQSSMA